MPSAFCPRGLVASVLSLLLLLAPPCRAQDAATFPLDMEIDLVFPRNATYAVVSPFPVVLGIRNAAGFLSYSTQLDWQMRCTPPGALAFGIQYYSGRRNAVVPSNPYFFINTSDVNPYYKSQGAEFDLLCRIEWEFEYVSTCERLPDGRLRSMVGYFLERKGSVNFTLSPGGKLPRDAILEYEATGANAPCPVPLTTVRIERNESGCPQIAAADPSPSPCALDMGSHAQSILSVLGTPTATHSLGSTGSPTSTSRSGGGRSGSGNGTGSGLDGPRSGGEDVDDAANRLLQGGVVGLVIALSGAVAGAIMVLL